MKISDLVKLLTGKAVDEAMEENIEAHRALQHEYGAVPHLQQRMNGVTAILEGREKPDHYKRKRANDERHT